MEHFLEQLESRLLLLDEDERRKIIQKYQTRMEQEIESGKSLDEVISDLGTVDSLVEEIYANYHINKTYREQKKDSNPINRGIESCAKVLAETVEDIFYYINRSNNGNALETFFSLLLKVLVLLLSILILKLPFWLLNEAGVVILDGLFYPFNTALEFLLDFVLSILYFTFCVGFGIYLFKANVKGTKKKEGVTKEEQVKKSKDGKKIKKQTDYFVIFLRAIIYVIAIIPLLLITLILFGLFVLAIFLIYKGVSLAGLAAILLGYFFLSVLLTVYLVDALNHKTRKYRFSVIVSLIALLVGHVLFVDNMISFHYPKTLEGSAFKPFTESTTISLKNDIYINSLTGDIETVVDNSLEENELTIEMTYYDELYDVILSSSSQDDKDYLILYPKRDDWEYYDIQYWFQNTLADLQENNIYNYDDLDRVDVKVYGTETTLARISK